MPVQFIKKHIRAIAKVFGVLSAVMVCDFLLLTTSLGLHWWRAVWGPATSRAMLTGLVVLSTIFCLLSTLRVWTNARVYQKRGYDPKLVAGLIAAIEGFMLTALSVAWGLLVLAGRPSALPLKLLGLVWISGFVPFTMLRVYELRHDGRRDPA